MRLNQLIFTVVFALAATSFMTGGHAHEMKIGNLLIDHPWSRQPLPSSAVAAGFMKITNTGSEDDRLLKATATISDTAQIHEMSMDNGIMKMGELARWPHHSCGRHRRVQAWLLSPDVHWAEGKTH